MLNRLMLLTRTYLHPTGMDKSMFSWVNQITHWLCGWTIEGTVNEGISNRIDEITHRLWVDIKERVSEGNSRLRRSRTSCVGAQSRKGQRKQQRVNEITHTLLGAQSKKRSAKASHRGIRRSRTSCVGGHRNRSTKEYPRIKENHAHAVGG